MNKTELKRVNADRFHYLLETVRDLSYLTVTDEFIINEKNVTNNNSITISNCEFTSEFQITGNHHNKKYFFNDCVFHQRFLAVNTNLNGITFLNCSFNQYFKSRHLNTNNLTFRFCDFNLIKQLVIEQFHTNNLCFENNEFNRDIHIIPKQAKIISLIGGESKSSLTLSNRGSKNNIDKLFVNFSPSIKTDFILRNLIVQNFHIKGELKNSSLLINSIQFGVGILYHFYNFSNLSITSLKPLNKNSIIVLKAANLGKAVVSSTNFSKFKKIQIKDCNLLDITPVNIEWCTSKSLKDENTLNDRLEIYRQLKLVAVKNLDIPARLMYYRYEMRTRLKVLNREKGNFLDKFILVTNQLSNNHGLNWIWAFWWLIGSSILWYTLVKFNLNQTVFNSELIGNEIGRFIKFINPAHRFDRVFEMNDSTFIGNAILFDSLSRITGAYLIFQFVSAFRKYTKK